MARPRKFDEADVLQCAMVAFWKQGYDSTTYRELEKLTGVGLRSLNNTFGDKDALFVRVLEAYRKMVTGGVAAFFDPPSMDALIAFFDAVPAPTESDEDPQNNGCLMVNTVMELPEKAPEVAEQITLYRQFFVDTFAAALRADGIAQVNTRAEFLVGSLWGMLSQIKLEGRKDAASPMAQILVQTLQSWKTVGAARL